MTYVIVIMILSEDFVFIEFLARNIIFKLNKVITTLMTDIHESMDDTQIETANIIEEDQITIDQNKKILPNLPEY